MDALPAAGGDRRYRGRATAQRRNYERACRPLRLLYERAATLAVSAASDCIGGREQIVLTAAAYELKALLSKQVCFVPNDPRRQAAHSTWA